MVICSAPTVAGFGNIRVTLCGSPQQAYQPLEVVVVSRSKPFIRFSGLGVTVCVFSKQLSKTSCSAVAVAVTVQPLGVAAKGFALGQRVANAAFLNNFNIGLNFSEPQCCETRPKRAA